MTPPKSGCGPMEVVVIMNADGAWAVDQYPRLRLPIPGILRLKPCVPSSLWLTPQLCSYAEADTLYHHPSAPMVTDYGLTMDSTAANMLSPG